MAYKTGSFSKSVVSNETNCVVERLEKIEATLIELETFLHGFNDTFSSTLRKERVAWKNFSNEELRLYQQTQSSMMNSVNLIRDAATEEYKQTLAAIQEHGWVVSTKVGFFILAILIISFCGWMYCMAELVR